MVAVLSHYYGCARLPTLCALLRILVDMDELSKRFGVAANLFENAKETLHWPRVPLFSQCSYSIGLKDTESLR